MWSLPQVESEPAKVTSVRPGKGWPPKGDIVFDNFSLR